MAELVDARDSNSRSSDRVRVRFSLWAHYPPLRGFFIRKNNDFAI